jgi:hypothetical protein
MLELAALILNLDNGPNRSDLLEVRAGVDLAEHVQNLDEWLRKGGFLPERWQR